jgi:UDP-glucuronate decarboxylase
MKIKQNKWRNEMKIILVTGGAGFLGPHLIRRLLEKDNMVICLDNFSSGSKENIKQFIDNPNFSIIEQDITNPIDTYIDEIYNLACPASPIYYMENPIYTIKTIVLGAINMLELAKKYNAKIFQASTSETYGDPIISPQSETYWGNVNFLGDKACYKESKRCAETLFMNYKKQHDINIRVIRLFNIYGNGVQPNDGRVISTFIQQALTNKDITVMGDGEQVRAFCYIDDAINGMITLMDSEIDTPTNIGNPVGYTINQLAEKIIELTNSESKIIHIDAQKDDSKQHFPDITKALKELDWKPVVNLEEGLIKTINYYKNLYNFKK